MAKIGMFLALVLVGCGGPSFTVGFKEIDQADSGPQADALAAAGGAPTVASGGKVGLSAGGQPGSGGAGSGGTSSGGARPSSGGLSGSGGAVDVDGGHDSGSGGEPADACVLVTHHTGIGQTWQDCVPPGTRTEAQAMKACNVWCAANGGCAIGFVCVDGVVCDSTTDAVMGVIGSPRAYIIMGWPLSRTNAVSVPSDPRDPLACIVLEPWD